jgi:16S rRNA (uracil1498-N3)-methyltransferase
MNLNKLPRILVDVALKLNENLTLGAEDSHYLANVLRLKVNDHLIVFNGKDGEWLAIIEKTTKKQLLIKPLSLLNVQTYHEHKFALAFAPIKAARMHFLIEKATELGISDFYPLKTTFSVVDKTSETKFSKWVKAALEQSQNIIIPGIHPLNDLKDFLLNKSKSANIIFCNESEHDNSIFKVLSSLTFFDKENIILIGPEGGFSEDEKSFISKLPDVYSVSISDNILRAETAAIVAIACCKNYIAIKN